MTVRTKGLYGCQSKRGHMTVRAKGVMWMMSEQKGSYGCQNTWNHMDVRTKASCGSQSISGHMVVRT